jgi:hypothetical protein
VFFTAIAIVVKKVSPQRPGLGTKMSFLGSYFQQLIKNIM